MGASRQWGLSRSAWEPPFTLRKEGLAVFHLYFPKSEVVFASLRVRARTEIPGLSDCHTSSRVSTLLNGVHLGFWSILSFA
jgi:hypothetical protein